MSFICTHAQKYIASEHEFIHQSVRPDVRQLLEPDGTNPITCCTACLKDQYTAEASLLAAGSSFHVLIHKQRAGAMIVCDKYKDIDLLSHPKYPSHRVLVRPNLLGGEYLSPLMPPWVPCTMRNNKNSTCSEKGAAIFSQRN